MNPNFPKIPVATNELKEKKENPRHECKLTLSKIDVDEDLKLDGWLKWQTRAEMVDALTLEEATALSFGINPAAICKLSDETTPTAERFQFRLTTLLAAAQKGQINLLVGEASSRVLNIRDFVSFEDFIQFLQKDRRTSVSKELIALALNIYESPEAKAKRFQSMPWKKQAEAIAYKLAKELQATGNGRPTDEEFLTKLKAACDAQGVKTSRGTTPARDTLQTEVFRDWTKESGWKSWDW